MNFKVKKLLKQLIEAKPAAGWDTANMTPKEKDQHWLHSYMYGKDFADESLHYNRHPEDMNPDIKLPGDDYKEPVHMDKEQALLLAQNPGTKTTELAKLANHPNLEVKRHVAANPNTHPIDLLNLANEGHHEEVASNPVLPLILKSFEHHPTVATKTLPKILNSSFMMHPDNSEARDEVSNFISNSENHKIRQLGVDMNNLNSQHAKNDDEELSKHLHDFDANKFYDDDYWNELVAKTMKHEEITKKLRNKEILFN